MQLLNPREKQHTLVSVKTGFHRRSCVYRTYFRALCDCISRIYTRVRNDDRFRVVNPFRLASEEQENVLSRGGLRKDDFARIFFAFIEVDAFDK